MYYYVNLDFFALLADVNLVFFVLLAGKFINLPRDRASTIKSLRLGIPQCSMVEDEPSKSICLALVSATLRRWNSLGIPIIPIGTYKRNQHNISFCP